MLTHEQLTAVFAEWDRRADAGGWEGNARVPEESARVFNEIAIALFPALGPARVKLGDIRPGDRIELDGGFDCIAAGIVDVHSDEGGLYFDCRQGRHALARQEDEPGAPLVGVISHTPHGAAS